MPVRLRLAMHGVRHNRIFHLVAIDLRKRRDARPLETLGIIKPQGDPETGEKTVQWAVERIKYWLEVGAQPSKSAVRLLTQGKLIPSHSKYHPKAQNPPPVVAPAHTPSPQKVDVLS